MDRRIRKSREAIKQAVVDLLDDNTIEQLSVTRIAKEADVNRKTFYNHFFSPQDVLSTLEDDLTERTLTVMRRFDYHSLSTNPQPLIKTLSREFDESLLFRRLLFEQDTSSRLIQKLKRTLKEELTEVYRARYSGDEAAFSYALSFIISGALDCYQEWYRSGRNMPLERLSRYIGALIAEGIQSVLENGET